MPKFSSSRVYQVDIKTLFHLLVKDSLKEFGVNDVDSQDLKGLKTIKEYQSKGKSVDTSVEIIEFIKNERYIIETRLKDILYMVDVKLEVVADNETKLTYSEIIKSTKGYKKISLSFVGFLNKSKFITKINRILEQVEIKLKNDNQSDIK